MIRTVLAALLAVLVVVAGTGGAQAQSEMTWKFQNDYKYKAQVKFFSSDRKGHVWPGQDRAYNLNDGGTHAVKISCLGGEKICYGGWVTGNSKLYWGVGADGKQGCENCCFKCQGNETPVIHLK